MRVIPPAAAAFFVMSLVAPPTLAQATSKRLDDLQQQIWQLKMGHAELKPSDGAFGIMTTDLVSVPVAIDDVAAYATGSKVLLRLGNITSATFGTMKLKILWGQFGKNGLRITDDKNSIDLDVVNPIAPGAWGKVEVLLPDTPPDKLGYMQVWLVEGPAIALRKY